MILSSNIKLLPDFFLYKLIYIFIISALTLDDEKREISQMICSFINKIEVIEKDKIEQYLTFYSEARASFSNLDNVISLLVHVIQI
jgi:hypothetical protein